jgi:hypothetical protein
MSANLAVSRPDDLAERIDQLVTLTGTGQSRAHEGYLANQALLEDAARRASSDLGRAAVTTMREAARQDYAAHLATVAGVRLEDHADPADAEAMRKEAAARREIAAGMRLDPNPEPPAPEPPNGDRPRGDFAKDRNMSGTNPDIVFEDGRQSVQPGGNDYSALQQQPAAVATAQEEEPQRQAVKVTAAELSQTDDAALEPMPEPFRPANTEPNATQTRALGVGIGPSGLETFEYQQPINHDAPAATPEPPRQAEPEATPAPEMATEQQQPAAERDAARIDQTATVARHDDQPTEQEVFTAQAVQRDAEASTKRQEAELPGAENITPVAERGNSVADQFRAAYESIKAEREGMSEGNEQDNSQDREAGRGEATAAFRSFGR